LGKPSFKDLAKLAKVSPATVSRIANGNLSVYATLKARVRKAAETLGIDLDQKRNESPISSRFSCPIGISSMLSRRESCLV
jgi:hypothetical protein